MIFRSRDTTRFEPDWLPLANVVGVVLAFVLLALHFERTRAEERSKLPTLALAQLPATNAEQLVLDILPPQGPATEPVVRIGDRAVEWSQLETELSAISRRFGTGKKAPLDRVTLIVRAAPDVPAGVVQQVVQICQQLGFARFALKGAEG
jgi:biopolymer transport protein ExbD